MAKFTEDKLEQAIVSRLGEQGYSHFKVIDRTVDFMLFDSGLFYAVGEVSQMMDAAEVSGRQWFKGKTASLLVYKSQDLPAMGRIC